MEKTNDVIGLGNALMDFLVEVEDSFIEQLGVNKGQFNLIEEEETAKSILQQLGHLDIKMVSGGSVANTIKGIARLGGKTVLYGKVGADNYGQAFIDDVRGYGIIPKITRSEQTTGHVISLVTPDAERTMSAYLGATMTYTKEEVLSGLSEYIQSSKILHLEGYQLDNQAKEVVLHAMELAKQHNTKVSIDVSDPGVIERNKDILKEIVKDYVDIIFLNEDEAKAYTGLEEEEALKKIAEDVDIAVVKLGKRGSLIYHNNQVYKIDPVLVDAVDTTGAGDTFAAGFLYGYTQNWTLDKAGKLGSIMAAKIVEQMGADYRMLNLDNINTLLE